MGLQLPNDLVLEIIHWLEVQSDLYNCCLVSKGINAMATPLLYMDFHDLNSVRKPIEDQIRTLQHLSEQPARRLEHVITFTIDRTKYESAMRLSKKGRDEMFAALEKCIANMPCLRTFHWASCLPIRASTLAALQQVKTITGLHIPLPGKNIGHSILDNKLLESQIYQFRNLESFKVYDFWTPNSKTIKDLAKVLLNSPKLTTLAISLSVTRCEVWELGYTSDVDDDEEEDDGDEHDTDLFEFFSALCREYASLTQNINGNTTGTSYTKTTPLLPLTNLEVGSCCILAKDVQLLTDLSVLKTISIDNKRQSLFGQCNPYDGLEAPALSAIAGLTPSLRSVEFDIFDYRADGLDINFSQDFPSLTDLFIKEPCHNLIQDITKCGGGDLNATRWKRLALGRFKSFPRKSSDDIEMILSSWILKCKELTHLYMCVEFENLPTLLTTISQLSHLEELHITIWSTRSNPLFESKKSCGEQLFANSTSLHIASVFIAPSVGFWRRNHVGGELSVVSESEIHMLNKDGFPREFIDLRYMSG